MAISSIPGLSPYLPALSTNNNTPAWGEDLLSAITHSKSTNSSSYVQDVVSLSTDLGIASTLMGGSNISSQAYTPQGLLNAYYNISDSNTSSSDALNLSSLSTLLNEGLDSTGATSGDALDINSRWVQTLQKNPDLASKLTQGLLDQGIVNIWA